MFFACQSKSKIEIRMYIYKNSSDAAELDQTLQKAVSLYLKDNINY